jgi:Tfp pilus assembly protein PilO
MQKNNSPLLIAVTVFVLFVGLVMMFVQWGSLRDEKVRLAEEEQQLVITEARLQSLIALEAKRDELDADGEVLEQLLPDGPQENQLIRDLQSGADLANMGLGQIRFSPRVGQEGFTAMPVGLSFTGTYHQLLSLLDYLQVYERAFRIQDLRVDMGSGEDEDMMISIQGSTFYAGE